MDRGKRDTKLLANFVNGFADGWMMAVKECYRNELDIKLTERKKNNQAFLEWTQGSYFAFAEGHLFYDTPLAYQKWEIAIKHIKMACKINAATPTFLDKNKKLVEGVVKFTIYKPNQHLKTLIADRDCQLSQNNFVKFLETGTLPPFSPQS